ncbi:hypothetical protein AC579_3517 [Pseudocercospora musae]|uniref:Uncharacterized protein n=1 Tax=Pseudocercospora musae TaxID=113226 RepID=A0A139I3E5_9PEZI|nr:hypothetical protein AC579_3517 [Pseudocercospora musae]
MPSSSDRKENKSSSASSKQPKSQPWGGTWPPKTEDMLVGIGAQFETKRKQPTNSRQEPYRWLLQDRDDEPSCTGCVEAGMEFGENLSQKICRIDVVTAR